MQLSRAIIHYYRCPEQLLDYQLSSPLSRDEGFFLFFSDICFGRSSTGKRLTRPGDELEDLAPRVCFQNGRVELPFNPSEVIDNLRLERYCESARPYGWRKNVYYAIDLGSHLLDADLSRKFATEVGLRFHFPGWPVDRTVESICEQTLLLALRAGAEKVPFIWFWPGAAHGAVMMTHDVETGNGRDGCAALMDIDDTFGVKASFQIVPETRYVVSNEFLSSIRERGFEVAVQDLAHDGRLFDDKHAFLERAAAINRYAETYKATSYRSAVLYRRPEWYGAFNFSADMSIPNVAHLDPQRGGCCTVMPYFIGNIVELPVTTTQDYMLLHLLNQRSIDLWKKQIELILEKHGLVSFIVHPDYLASHEAKTIYKELLKHLRELCSDRNLWFALPREIDRWWRLRSQMRLCNKGGLWSIIGEGAEKAQLAFAFESEGRLVYQLASSN